MIVIISEIIFPNYEFEDIYQKEIKSVNDANIKTYINTLQLKSEYQTDNSCLSNYEIMI